jgi:hypothetical protein
MKATSRSWKTKRLPAARARLQLERSFSAAEWVALQLGVIPEEMEDKWFIYESRGWLSFHRSWTGVCIYRIQLRKTPVGAEIIEAWVNRKTDQYSCVDDVYDTALVSWLIDVLLLRREAPWPESGMGDEALRKWSLVGRAMLAHDDEGTEAAALDRALRDMPDR